MSKAVNGPNEPFKYKNGDRVKWKANYFYDAEGYKTGTVVGVSSTSVAVIGAGFPRCKHGKWATEECNEKDCYT